MLLFIVEDRYMLTGIGLTLVPGTNKARVGDRIKLVKPDQTIILTSITAKSFQFLHVVVGKELGKSDIPIGTEVWSCEE